LELLVVRSFPRFLAVVALITLAGAACSSAASQSGRAGPVTLRVGDQNKTLAEPLNLAGQATGTPYGLAWSNFLDGPHMNAAFLAGLIDFGFMGDTPALLATAAHADVVVVGAIRYQPNSIFELAVKPGSNIKTLTDLRGKKVAFTQGTALQGYLLQALDSVGLTQHDITPVNVPGASLSTTVQSGDADAAVLSSYVLTSYLASNSGASALPAPVSSYTLLLATRKALSDTGKREAIYDFVSRLAKAGRWVQANENTFVQDYYVNYQHQTPAAAKQSYQRSGPPLYTAPTADLIQHQRTQAGLLVRVGELPQGFNAADQFDPAATQAADRAIQGALAS
jgi:sulfonate transport system substrate-binding protein